MAAMRPATKAIAAGAGAAVIVAAVAAITALAAAPHLLPAAAATPVASSTPDSSPSPSPSPTTSPATTSAQRAVRLAAAQAEATVLGITTAQLASDLRQGTTVQQLAAQKGISQAGFQSSFVQDLTPLLDQDVQRGTITSRQEQQALRRLGAQVPNWSKAPTRQ